MADNVVCEIDVQGEGQEVIPEQFEQRADYGSVPGLEDEELADPEELERQVMIADWGPILQLPIRGRKGGIQPAIDEFGQLDWGAFGTVDFHRLAGPFDKARFKADKLEEEVRHTVIMLEAVAQRLPPAKVGQLMVQLRGDGHEAGEFMHADEQAFARWYLRVKRLRHEIGELREFSWEQRRRLQ